MRGKWLHHETTVHTYTIGYCYCAGTVLLYQQVATAGDKTAGGGGQVLPFYICEFFIGGCVYADDRGVGGEVVWAIICYSAIFGPETGRNPVKLSQTKN